LHAAAREASNDAAPLALVAATILIALALVAKHALVWVFNATRKPCRGDL
jgi:hypothetical protein